MVCRVNRIHLAVAVGAYACAVKQEVFSVGKRIFTECDIVFAADGRTGGVDAPFSGNRIAVSEILVIIEISVKNACLFPIAVESEIGNRKVHIACKSNKALYICTVGELFVQRCGISAYINGNVHCCSAVRGNGHGLRNSNIHVVSDVRSRARHSVI